MAENTIPQNGTSAADLAAEKLNTARAKREAGAAYLKKLATPEPAAQPEAVNEDTTMVETIPQNVIEALADARAMGTYNMFDRRGVTKLVEMIDEGAAVWLYENKDQYMDALNAMGEYISKPEPVRTAELLKDFDDESDITPADYAAVAAMGETAANIFGDESEPEAAQTELETLRAENAALRAQLDAAQRALEMSTKMLVDYAQRGVLSHSDENEIYMQQATNEAALLEKIEKLSK